MVREYGRAARAPPPHDHFVPAAGHFETLWNLPGCWFDNWARTPSPRRFIRKHQDTCWQPRGSGESLDAPLRQRASGRWPGPEGPTGSAAATTGRPDPPTPSVTSSDPTASRTSIPSERFQGAAARPSTTGTDQVCAPLPSPLPSPHPSGVTEKVGFPRGLGVWHGRGIEASRRDSRGSIKTWFKTSGSPGEGGHGREVEKGGVPR